MTWLENPIKLDTTPIIVPGLGYSSESHISSDENGHVYATWSDKRRNSQLPDIYFNYSNDYGMTWQANDIRLNTGDAPGANRSWDPQLSSDSNGHVYVTWKDFRNRRLDIYLNYSDDYGVTWQKDDIRLDTGVCSWCK